MFTYEWLGRPSESGIPPVLDRSILAELYASLISMADLETAIAHAKSLLERKVVFPAGQTYGVRILNNDSVLVWIGSADDA